MHIQNASLGQNQWWRYLLTLVIMIITFVIGQLPLGIVLELYREQSGLSETAYNQAVQTLNTQALGISDNIYMLLILSPFVLAGIGLLLSFKFIHRKPLLSVFTSRDSFDWKRFFFAGSYWFILATILLLLLVPSDTYQYQLDWSKFIPLVFIALLLIPIQTSVEEVLFRGYLLQGFYLLTKHKLISISIVTLIFAGMHLGNPEIQAGGMKMIWIYILLSVFLGAITVLDKGLELPMGVHAGNNLFGALILSTADGAFHTSSIYQTTVGEISSMIPIGLAVLILSSFAIFYFKYKWKG